MIVAMAAPPLALGYRPAPVWIPIGPGGQDITALAYNSVDPQRMYVALRASGVYRGDGIGAAWISASNGLPAGSNVTTLLNLSGDGSRVLALADGEPYITSDSGGHWLAANKGLPAHPEMAVAATLPGTASSVFLGGAAGLFMSDDGVHWRQLNGGLPARGHITFIAATNITSGVVLAGVAFVHVHGGNVYRSVDFGRHWREADHGLPDNVVPEAGQWSRQSPDTAWIAAGGMYRTDDMGGHWRKDGFGLPAHVFVRAMTFGAADAAFVADGTAFYARAAGSNAWLRAPKPWPGRAAVHILAIAADGNIIAATAAGLYRASAAGWTNRGDGLPVATSVYSLLATHDGALVAGVEDGAWRFSAGSWTSIGDGLPTGANVHAIVELPYAPYRLYCATDYGVFQLNDGRDNWQMIGGVPAGRAVSAFAYARGSDTLYAAVVGDAIYAAPVATLHWKAIANTRRLGYVNVLLVDARGHWILAGSRRSSDNGHSWKQTGLRGVLSAIQLSDRTGTVLAGTASSGAFNSHDGGAHWTPTDVSGRRYENVSLLSGASAGSTPIALAFAGNLPYVSVDSGQSWRPMAATAPTGPVTSASLAPALPMEIVVGTVGNGVQLLSPPIALPQSGMATETPAPTITPVVTSTATPTSTRMPTWTATRIATRTATNTPSTTPSRASSTPTATKTPSARPHPTRIPTPGTGTDTPVPTLTGSTSAAAY